MSSIGGFGLLVPNFGDKRCPDLGTVVGLDLIGQPLTSRASISRSRCGAGRRRPVAHRMTAPKVPLNEGERLTWRDATIVRQWRYTRGRGSGCMQRQGLAGRAPTFASRTCDRGRRTWPDFRGGVRPRAGHLPHGGAPRFPRPRYFEVGGAPTHEA